MASSQDDLCPVDSRRTSRELYVKLFVVNFTVLAAYAHLIRLRKDRWPVAQVVLAFCCPLGRAVYFYIQLMAVVVQIIVCRRFDEIRISAAILFGSLDVHPEDVSTDTKNGLPRSVLSRLSRTFGRCLLPLALMSQCVTAIYLFKRRVEHRADALYDHMILQVAILGIIVALLTFIQEMCALQCSLLEGLSGLPARVKHLRFLRDVPHFQRAEERKNISDWHLIYQPLLAGTVLFTAPFFGLKTSLPLHDTLWEFGPKLARNLLLLSGMIMYPGRKRFFRDSWTDWHVIVALLCIVFKAGAAVVVLWSSPSFAWVFDYYKLMQPHPDLNDSKNSIAALSQLPTNLSCPQAWKDPVADYVWWLA